MNSLDRRIEAILFALARAVTLKELSVLCAATPDACTEALKNLQERLLSSESGLQLVEQGNEVELVTHGDLGEDVRNALKQETSAELSKAALETLAILAYRGPLTRPEIEQVRGVQSALMLRNLMLRGLVEQHEEERLGQPTYRVTLTFLKQLGLEGVDGLPDYASMRQSPTVMQVLDELGTQQVE